VIDADLVHQVAEMHFSYGLCLERGLGAQQDMDKASIHYKLAADENVAQAHFQYALCFATSIGVAKV
jgi:TPR repeat protein